MGDTAGFGGFACDETEASYFVSLGAAVVGLVVAPLPQPTVVTAKKLATRINAISFFTGPSFQSWNAIPSCPNYRNVRGQAE